MLSRVQSNGNKGRRWRFIFGLTTASIHPKPRWCKHEGTTQNISSSQLPEATRSRGVVGFKMEGLLVVLKEEPPACSLESLALVEARNRHQAHTGAAQRSRCHHWLRSPPEQALKKAVQCWRARKVHGHCRPGRDELLASAQPAVDYGI